MKQVVELEELRRTIQTLPQPLGFVPTMGFLHDGHISLADLAKMECETVVASIFVNPAQFGPGEDLSAYPRDILGDLEKLEKAGVDLVWLPTPQVMYPTGFNTWVSVEGVSESLEGAARPHHFRGVATVVTKLFTAVGPDFAYFGQKDAQQVAVIKQLTRDLNFPIQIVVCPTVREPDGLAMSSRNTYLNADERRAAKVLYRALEKARTTFSKGERNSDALRTIMRETIASEPLAKLQYASCADPETLQELDQVVDHALLSLAVFIGKTRLIDNILLG
ncbi:MAG: pantoate--beta-alanine ligase [Anaerolineales bacterium]